MTDARKLISEGMAHDAAAVDAKNSYSEFTDDRYDRAAYAKRCALARAWEVAVDARIKWCTTNLRTLLDGYATALDEVDRLRTPLGDARLHEIAQRYQDADTPGQCLASMRDVPILMDEVTRLRTELGHATLAEGDWLSKTSRAMCETMMGERDALRAEVRRLRAELAQRDEPTG